MDLRAEYDVWHQRVFDSDPEHEDASTPWYQLVRERLGDVAGLSVLEVACGRGGFVCDLHRRGARVTGCDFSSAWRCTLARRDCGGRLWRRACRASCRVMPKDCRSRDASFDMRDFL